MGWDQKLRLDFLLSFIALRAGVWGVGCRVWGWEIPGSSGFRGLPPFPIGRSEQKRPLGHDLKAANLLDDKQIDAIPAEQHQDRKRFGELAVQKGWLKKQTVDSILWDLTGSDMTMTA